jgi:hypothetical protein
LQIYLLHCWQENQTISPLLLHRMVLCKSPHTPIKISCLARLANIDVCDASSIWPHASKILDSW